MPLPSFSIERPVHRMDLELLNSKNISSQEILHRVEELCTAEEAAACTAACPLHVDARELCRLIAKQKYEEAFKLYRKQVSFPRILAHVCEAPCKDFCKRKDFGGAVLINELEKTMAREVKKAVKPPMLISKKKEKVAVIGGGIRGMSAAYELARKGYGVKIYEKTQSLGGKLLHRIPEELPREVFDQERGLLEEMGAEIEYGREIGDAAELLDRYQGVYVSVASDRGYEEYDNILSLHAQKKQGQKNNAALEMQQGKSAALTLDRILQKVNTEIGREREGSYESRLFTDLSRVVWEEALPFSDKKGYDKGEAAKEAGRCIQCRCDICIEKCVFLQKYGKNPRQYVREVYNNLAIAMGTHHANKMINTCALCSQCGALCPNGLDMAKVFLAARQRMQESRKMPPSAFEFGLLDLEHGMSEHFFLAAHQKSRSSSAFAFFPGCQLPASEPRLVKEVYKDLCKRLEGGVGILLSCCGIPAHWAGKKDVFEQSGRQIRAAWEELGKPRLITACPNCRRMLEKHLKIAAENIFELVEEGMLLKEQRRSRKMLLHHACGSRFDEDTKRSVRVLAAALNIELSEKFSVESTCCGWGGLVSLADAETAAQLRDAAIEQIEGGESLPILTYCVNCRDRFLKKGRESYHLLELLYEGRTEAEHKFPFWSERRDNRTRLKRELSEELRGVVMEEKKRLNLVIEAELEEKMERLHILRSDIEEVIEHAQEEKSYFINQETGRNIACYRPANVSFWVEYAQEGDGYKVFNAYSHRMEFIMDGSLTKGEYNE